MYSYLYCDYMHGINKPTTVDSKSLPPFLSTGHCKFNGACSCITEIPMHACIGRVKCLSFLLFSLHTFSWAHAPCRENS